MRVATALDLVRIDPKQGSFIFFKWWRIIQCIDFVKRGHPPDGKLRFYQDMLPGLPTVTCLTKRPYPHFPSPSKSTPTTVIPIMPI